MLSKPLTIHVKKPKQTSGDWAFYRQVSSGKIEIGPYSRIKNEAQFCKFIYDNWGEGRYQCLAWQKGYEGFWLFWLGNIYSNGFIRETNKNKEVDKLKAQFVKAQSFEEKQDIEDEIQFEKELYEIDRKKLDKFGKPKRTKRRGPVGITTMRPGIMHEFQEYI